MRRNQGMTKSFNASLTGLERGERASFLSYPIVIPSRQEAVHVSPSWQSQTLGRILLLLPLFSMATNSPGVGLPHNFEPYAFLPFYPSSSKFWTRKRPIYLAAFKKEWTKELIIAALTTWQDMVIIHRKGRAGHTGSGYSIWLPNHHNLLHSCNLLLGGK